MKKYLPQYSYELFFDPSIDNIIGFIFTIFPWVLMIYWIIISTKMVRNPSNYSYFRINSIPTVFVTIGLLGTFLGITFGLLHFDTSPDKIKDSIVILLSGLKSAFFTSITGITLSLVYAKINRRLFSDRLVNEPKSIEYDILTEISSTLKEIKSEHSTGNNNLLSIRDDIKKQTKETTKVSENIQNFAETLGKNNAQAITNALQDIIEDFNNTFKNFIEQLVDKNFDRLTESVNQLIEWQKEYKVDISHLINAYQALVSKHNEFVNTTENWVQNLDEIAGRSSELQNIIKDFKAVFNEESNFSLLIGKIENSVNHLELSTKNISDVSEGIMQATTAFNSTKDEITNWLEREDGVRDAVITHSEALKELRQFDISSIEKLDKSFYDRLGNTFNQLDSLMKEYVNYLEAIK